MPHKPNPGLFQKVYEVVRKIPKGKVMTYGQIAKIVETRDVRKIGWALHANPDADLTPCHRVVNKEGEVSESYAFDGWKEQRRKLEAEGVKFISEKAVNLEKYLWQG